MNTQPKTEHNGSRTSENPRGFAGFDVPHQNWFKLPNGWTDLTATMQSWAEQKVVEYVLRHTWGYQEYGSLKRITLDEFEQGRRRGDGTRLDKGIGMRRQAIISGIRQAVEDAYLIEYVDDADRGRVRKYYGLHMLANEAREQGYDLHTPGVWSSHSQGMTITHRSEKDTLERHPRKKPLTATFHRLQSLNQPEEKTEYVTQAILEQLGDKHSLRFYRLVAAKVPEPVIRQALAEVKVDGADNPAKLFTYKMQRYALGVQKAEGRHPSGK